MIEQLRIIILKKHCFKKLYIAVKHLDLCFLATFIKSRCLEVLLEKSGAYKSKFTQKIYVDLKYGACNLKNEVSAHRLGLVVQLSWRVAPPLSFVTTWVLVQFKFCHNLSFGVLSQGTQQKDQQWIGLSNCILPGLRP